MADGLSDSGYLSGQTKAANNAELVARIAGLIRAMDLEVASPQETRRMLYVQ
ncbi:3-keto-5-aminohexanoate cleavage protein [Paenibacillus albidus]|uniref:3-keto-5-aminohexanoate cleavage protein n=1 Tax=Paenibacillus albidus TaxID=2041023 RepID=UPI001BE61864|nr:3-keto-5-aminohexanoate cleavage protein [Paenibacillus albidus]MBT2288796.1 3-keto-5-aminohexanoate cleavage protein [Paenibacillus albidus]